MKMLLWLVFTFSLWANDGGWLMSGNQLIPVFESNISITKEILTIKRVEGRILDVKVEYTFLNPAKAKKILVGFEAGEPESDGYEEPKNGEHPYMNDFSVFMNSKKLSYKVAIPSQKYIPNMKYRTDNTKMNLENTGYIYYFDAKFEKGENKLIHHYRYESSSSTQSDYMIKYILTTAKRWANRQIDDFTLILDMGDYTSFFIEKGFFKAYTGWAVDGLIRDKAYYFGDFEVKGSIVYVHQGVAVFHKKNFKINGELLLLGGGIYSGDTRNDDYNDYKNVFDFRKHRLPFMQEHLNIGSHVANDALSDKILRNLPYARRGYVFKNKEIQKYYESLEWYKKRPKYKAKKSDLTQEEKEFYITLRKTQLHILRNLPYAKRKHLFKNEALKVYFEAQKWYQENKYQKNGTLNLSEAEKKWLKKINTIGKKGHIEFHGLMEEYEKIFLENSEYITYLAAQSYPLSPQSIERVKEVNASMFQGSYHFGESEGESTITILWSHGELYGNEETYIFDYQNNDWIAQNKRLKIVFKNGKLEMDGTSYELYRAIVDNTYLNIQKGDLFILSRKIFYDDEKIHFDTQLNPQDKLIPKGKYPEVHRVKLPKEDLSGYNSIILKNMLDEILSPDNHSSDNEQVDFSEIEEHNIELLRMELASWYSSDGAYEKSINIYKEVIYNSPKNEEAFYKMGNVYKRKKEYDKAINSYTKAIEINATHIYAWHYMGDCFHEKKEYRKALDIYEKVRKIDPEYADNYYMMGITYHDMQMYDKAIFFYNKAIEIDPGHCALYHLGNAYRVKKEYNNSIVAYKKSVEHNCREEDAYTNMGISYVDIKEYDKAIGVYEKTLEIKPKYAIVYNNMAIAYNRKKEYKKALGLYQKAIKLDTNYAAPHYNLGILYIDIKAYKKALEYLDKTLKLNPRYSDAYYAKGYIYKLEHHYIKAILSQQKAREANLQCDKLVFSKAMNQKALAILKNLPYAKRGHVFKNKDLKTFYEAQKWYKEESNYIARVSDLSSEEIVWLDKLKALTAQDTVDMYVLMDEYEAIAKNNKEKTTESNTSILEKNEYTKEESIEKAPSKPYYELAYDGIDKIIQLGFYNKWVPMYQSKPPKFLPYPQTTITQLSKERKEILNDLYQSTDLIAILKVTHFYIYAAPSNESGYNVKFRANVVKVIKGKYTKKTIEFHGDFDNAPDAESYDQLYCLHRSEDPVEYQSDEFVQYNPVGVELDYFNFLEKEMKEIR